jgi:hypothetical protein
MIDNSSQGDTVMNPNFCHRFHRFHRLQLIPCTSPPPPRFPFRNTHHTRLDEEAEVEVEAEVKVEVKKEEEEQNERGLSLMLGRMRWGRRTWRQIECEIYNETLGVEKEGEGKGEGEGKVIKEGDRDVVNVNVRGTEPGNLAVAL